MATKAPSPKIAAIPPPAPAFMPPELGALVLVCADADEVVEDVPVLDEDLLVVLEPDEDADELLFAELDDDALADVDDAEDVMLPVPPETENGGEKLVTPLESVIWIA